MKFNRKLKLVADDARPLAPLTQAEKLISAKQFLGERWLLHKSNAIGRRGTPYGELK
jgi:hypothetical protein